MKYPIDWSEEKEVRRLFSYQTRIGIAPKFGVLPMGWYQVHQDKAYQVIMNLIYARGLKSADITTRSGQVLINGEFARYAGRIYAEADMLSRV